MSRIIRVFPRQTKATPTDALTAIARVPDLFDEADEVHVSVSFTYDKDYAERLAEEWRYVAPVKIGGVAYGDTSLEFSLEDCQVDLLARLRPRPNMFFAYDPGDAFETLESAARRLIEAGFTARAHRLRCYVLIGFPKDSFDQADARLRSMLDIGFTPMAMLWRPETASQQRYSPPDEWRAFQRRWARPAIIHSLAGREHGGGDRS
jgi:hypothetical protein